MAHTIQHKLNVKDYGATGDGSTNDYAAINDAITAIGSTEVILVFPTGTYRIGTSLTFNVNTTLQFEAGATVEDNGTAGVVFTINGNVVAPSGQHFDFTGAGSGVTIASDAEKTSEVKLSWWGNDSTAFQAAVDSGAVKFFADQDMTLASTISLPGGISIEGFLYRHDNGEVSGTPGTRFTFTGTGACFDLADAGADTTYGIYMNQLRIDGTTNANNNITGLKLEDIRHSTFSNLYIVGFGAASTGGVGVQLDANFSWSTVVKFDKCRILANDTGVLMSQSGASLCNENEFNMCTFNLNGTGVLIEDGVSNRFVGCNVQGNTVAGIQFEDHDNTIMDCYFEAHGAGVPAVNIPTGSDGYNTVLIGNYFIGNTIDVSNPDVLDLLRLDANDPHLLPQFIQHDLASTTYLRFYASNDGSLPNCMGLYDSNTSQWIMFYDKAGGRVYSEIGWGTRAAILEYTSDDTLATTDTGSTVTNRGAAGTVTVALPNAQKGLQYIFIRTENQVFRVDPVGTSDLIRGGGVNKYLQLNAQGDSVKVTCTRNNVWEVEYFNGTYTFEP